MQAFTDLFFTALVPQTVPEGIRSEFSGTDYRVLGTFRRYFFGYHGYHAGKDGIDLAYIFFLRRPVVVIVVPGYLGIHMPHLGDDGFFRKQAGIPEDTGICFSNLVQASMRNADVIADSIELFGKGVTDQPMTVIHEKILAGGIDLSLYRTFVRLSRGV